MIATKLKRGPSKKLASATVETELLRAKKHVYNTLSDIAKLGGEWKSWAIDCRKFIKEDPSSWKNRLSQTQFQCDL